MISWQDEQTWYKIYEAMNKTAAHKSPSAATPYKLTVKQISLELTQDEANQLEKYCKQTGKAATDVIQELIQSLPET